MIKQALNDQSSFVANFLKQIQILPSDTKKPPLNKIAKEFRVEYGIVKCIHDYYHIEDFAEPLPIPNEKPQSLTDLALIIHKAIKQYVVCTPYESKALTLWILQTWFVDYVERVPYLVINSPEPECGKSQLLKLLGLCCRKSCSMPSLTAPSISRVLNADTPPTLLIDEVDSNIEAFHQAADIINDGYERDGRSFRADLNDQKKIVVNKNFSNKAFAGLNILRKLKPAVISRSIVIRLKQVEADDEKDPVGDLTLNKNKTGWVKIRSCMRRLELDLGNEFTEKYHENNFKLEYPRGIRSKRQKDIWRGIFVIAQLAKRIDENEMLLQWAQESMNAQANLKLDNEDRNSRLSSNLKAIFSKTSLTFLPTQEIVHLLNSNREWGWNNENGGRGITDRIVTDFMATYYLKSKLDRKVGKRGFYVQDVKTALNIH